MILFGMCSNDYTLAIRGVLKQETPIAFESKKLVGA